MKSKEMGSVLTVPDCARFLQGHPIYAENTHAEFSKSPKASYLWYFGCLQICIETVPAIVPGR